MKWAHDGCLQQLLPSLRIHSRPTNMLVVLQHGSRRFARLVFLIPGPHPKSPGGLICKGCPAYWRLWCWGPIRKLDVAPFFPWPPPFPLDSINVCTNWCYWAALPSIWPLSHSLPRYPRTSFSLLYNYSCSNKATSLGSGSCFITHLQDAWPHHPLLPQGSNLPLLYCFIVSSV